MGDFCFSIDEERYDDRHGHVLSLDGWYSHPDRKTYGFELLGDGYDTVELPEIQRRERPDVAQALGCEFGDFLPGFTVQIPEVLKLAEKYQSLELFLRDGEERVSIWEIDHRYTGATHSAECSRDQIHDTTAEIRNCCVCKDFNTALDNIRVTCIQSQQFIAKEIRAASQGKRNCKRQNDTVHQDFVHTLRLAYAIILACKTHAGLRNRIDRHIQKSKDIIGCRITCHGDRAKGIYGRLQQCIGNIDDCALDSCRDPYLKDRSAIS